MRGEPGRRRASEPRPDVAHLAAHLEASYRIADVRALRDSYAAVDAGTTIAILDQANAFAAQVLEPLNLAMDVHGVRLVDDRVRTAPGHREAWATFVESGWPGIGHPEDCGGQQMPLAMCLAVQEVFDRACPAFGMLSVPQRSAAKLVAAYGSDETRAELLPGIGTGEIGATICISESGAGSDVAQMRMRAVPTDGGNWLVSGEKCWISFGDHDLTTRIVHCLLARTDPPGSERPEISLFIVEGEAARVTRVEEKLGLHGSPTCVLAFEDAPATLLGERGRGLAQMFVMITQMRLAVGAMGLGIASAAVDTAIAYAKDRRQGGPPGGPVAIIGHPDVQRQLLELIARTETLRALTLATANLAEIAALSPVAEERTHLGALVQWLLPVVKTFGAEVASDNASGAIQVLGGAGYTRDWPAEQLLRDARVLAIFEGTSGIQAIDMVHRRTLRDRTGLDAFLAIADAEENPALALCVDRLRDAADRLAWMDREGVDAGAKPFLDLAILAASGWAATRVLGNAAATGRMMAGAGYWLDRIGPRANLAFAEAVAGGDPLKLFALV